jgi:DNA-binding LytR/AlgR family response regulator
LIIEDELLIAEMLKEMLLELGYHVAGIAKNFEIALTQIQKDPEINFAIIDINLNEPKTGKDVASVLLNEYRIPFIFLTSYSDKKTISEAVLLKPEAYLVKPFSRTDLFTTLEIVKTRKRITDKTIIIKEGRLQVKLQVSSILWIKSENIYVEVVTQQKTYVIRNSLDKIIEEINDGSILRIHRSYAVNATHIKAVNGQYVLIGMDKIPLSRKFRDEILARFAE